ncbi:MAG: DUF2949 domain-containing protein [Leptolyngbya sp. SIO4C1]|nr:DUF2949 domain-containing protein [Leptolyngbya sp. SIO4C1]
MNAAIKSQMLDFLQHELQIAPEALSLALSHQEQATQLPMILWQYGLVTLPQLDQIFDWLEQT